MGLAEGLQAALHDGGVGLGVGAVGGDGHVVEGLDLGDRAGDLPGLLVLLPGLAVSADREGEAALVDGAAVHQDRQILGGRGGRGVGVEVQPARVLAQLEQVLAARARKGGPAVVVPDQMDVRAAVEHLGEGPAGDLLAESAQVEAEAVEDGRVALEDDVAAGLAAGVADDVLQRQGAALAQQRLTEPAQSAAVLLGGIERRHLVLGLAF